MLASSDAGLLARDRRARRNQVWLMAAIVPGFCGLDWMTVGHFSPGAFAVRLLWGAMLFAFGARFPGASARELDWLLAAVGGLSAILLGVIVQLTGGVATPLFHW